METIKTVGDLKKLIAASEGDLKIGPFSFRHIPDEDETVKVDVDIYFNDTLFAWFSGPQDDAALDSGFSVAGEFKDIKKNEAEFKMKISALETENETLKSEKAVVVDLLETQKLSAGKVEAYEKLLIGRTVTLGA